MNCTEFKERIEAHGHERSRLTGDLREHAAACAESECRQLWRDAWALDRAVAAWRRFAPRVDCADQVVSRWRAERTTVAAGASPASRGHGRSPWPASSTARSRTPAAAMPGTSWFAVLSVLGILAAISAIVATGPQPAGVVADRDAPTAVDVAVHESPAAPTPDSPPASTEESGLQDVGSSYVGVAQSATWFVTDVVMLALGDREDVEDPTIDPEWIDQWGQQLQPVGEEVDNAVDGLFRTFPDSSAI